MFRAAATKPSPSMWLPQLRFFCAVSPGPTQKSAPDGITSFALAWSRIIFPASTASLLVLWVSASQAWLLLKRSERMAATLFILAPLLAIQKPLQLVARDA